MADDIIAQAIFNNFNTFNENNNNNSNNNGNTFKRRGVKCHPAAAGTTMEMVPPPSVVPMETVHFERKKTIKNPPSLPEEKEGVIVFNSINNFELRPTAASSAVPPKTARKNSKNFVPEALRNENQLRQVQKAQIEKGRGGGMGRTTTATATTAPLTNRPLHLRFRRLQFVRKN